MRRQIVPMLISFLLISMFSAVTIFPCWSSHQTELFEETDGAVTFLAMGLPNGAQWTAVLGGQSQSATYNAYTGTGGRLDFSVQPGTYQYLVSTTATGYYALPNDPDNAEGSVSVSAGGQANRGVTFTNYYNIYFKESGFPSNKLWGVVINGSGSSQEWDFIGSDPAPNSLAYGTYSWTVVPISGYTASPQSDTFTTSQNLNISITFTATQPVGHVDCYDTAAAESLTLNAGSEEYFFVGSTAGGFPMDSITWAQDLNVTAAYSGNVAITIGHSSSNAGSFYGQSGNHGIAGTGVSGFVNYNLFSASTSTGTSTSLQFSTTSGDLVVILVGGEGDGDITLAGISAQTLVDQTYSEAGGGVIASVAIFTAMLPSGTYTVNFSSTTNPSNAGTSIGAVVYVFLGSSSIQSSTSVMCSPNPVTVASSATCTASVSGSNPTGTVTWRTSSSSGFFTSPTSTLSSGICSTNYTDTSVGSVTITADYSGDSNNAPSSGNTTLEVTSFNSATSFSIFWITDTQHLSFRYPEKFINLTNWIINNSNYYNAKMVVHTGDIVDDAGVTSEWDAANAAISLLLNNNIPYCWCAGNHDQLGSPDADWIGSQYQAFNQTAMEQKPYWVSDICNGKDTAVHFRVNNLDFLIIDIEYSANDTVLSWANDLLNTYPNAYTILATHFYLNHGLTYVDGLTGTSDWSDTLRSEVLEPHKSNLFMTLNGHDHGDFGNHVTVGSRNELVFDRQESHDTVPTDQYGDGAATVTILTFDTADNQIAVKTFDVNTGQFMTDSNDQFSLATAFRSVANHDVSIEGIASSKVVVGSGYSLLVNVTATNVGDFTEDFSVTTYANSTIIASQNVTLPAGNSATATFIWNTAGFAQGNYTIGAYAWPVLGETNIANNNCTGGNVAVTIPGDLNGDFKVDMRDIALVARAFGSTSSSGNWNPNADINSDGTVNMKDIALVARHFGQHYP